MGFFFEYYSLCYLLKHYTLPVVDKTYQRLLVHKKFAVPRVDTSVSAASVDADDVSVLDDHDEMLMFCRDDIKDESTCSLFHLSSRSCRFSSPNFPFNLSTLFIPDDFNFIAFDAMCTCKHSPEIANAIETTLDTPLRTSPRFKGHADVQATQSPQPATPTHHLMFIQVTTASHHGVRNVDGAKQVVTEWTQKANEWAKTQAVVFGDPILLFITPINNDLQYHFSYAAAGLNVQFVMQLSVNGMSTTNLVARTKTAAAAKSHKSKKGVVKGSGGKKKFIKKNIK
jgi:hypothetical protein